LSRRFPALAVLAFFGARRAGSLTGVDPHVTNSRGPMSRPASRTCGFPRGPRRAGGLRGGGGPLRAGRAAVKLR
jgi:hypothetical protein